MVRPSSCRGFRNLRASSRQRRECGAAVLSDPEEQRHRGELSDYGERDHRAKRLGVEAADCRASEPGLQPGSLPLGRSYPVH